MDILYQGRYSQGGTQGGTVIVKNIEDLSIKSTNKHTKFSGN